MNQKYFCPIKVSRETAVTTGSNQTETRTYHENDMRSVHWNSNLLVNGMQEYQESQESQSI